MDHPGVPVVQSRPTILSTRKRILGTDYLYKLVLMLVHIEVEFHQNRT
jgi:hypothetical protein